MKAWLRRGHFKKKWPIQLELQNTQTVSRQRSKTPPMSVLDVTLNNLMVRFQLAEALGNKKYSFTAIALVLIRPGVVAPDWVLSMSKKELNYVLVLD